MKLLHISDLHLGKRLNEYSLLEDQRDALCQVLAALRAEMPCCLLVAGDVYDRAVPSAEAVGLFDWFLTQVSQLGAPAIVISGNHDSAERLAFGGALFQKGNIHLSPVYTGSASRVVLTDEYGPVVFHLLPFVKPSGVRSQLPEAEGAEDEEALRLAISSIPLEEGARNVLLYHGTVLGGVTSESEEALVGGVCSISPSVFSGFDYVALGHLHNPQTLSPNLRYSGSLLPYSFSETGQKSVTVAELSGQGSLSLREIPLRPLRPMVTLRGRYEELMHRPFYENTELPNSYIHAILTDEEDVPNAALRLSLAYPYLMKVTYDNLRSRESELSDLGDLPALGSPIAVFAALYEAQHHTPLSKEQERILEELLEEVEA